jgi:hypothetical protein
VSAELDLDLVRGARRFFDPVGHYNRPDVFRLAVDTAPRPTVVEMDALSHLDRGAGKPASDDQATAAGSHAKRDGA